MSNYHDQQNPWDFHKKSKRKIKKDWPCCDVMYRLIRIQGEKEKRGFTVLKEKWKNFLKKKYWRRYLLKEIFWKPLRRVIRMSFRLLEKPTCKRERTGLHRYLYWIGPCKFWIEVIFKELLGLPLYSSICCLLLGEGIILLFRIFILNVNEHKLNKVFF